MSSSCALHDELPVELGIAELHVLGAERFVERREQALGVDMERGRVREHDAGARACVDRLALAASDDVDVHEDRDATTLDLHRRATGATQPGPVRLVERPAP